MARSAQLVALGLLSCVTVGAAFQSDFQALYLLGTPLSGSRSSPLRGQRAGALGRRNREQQQQQQQQQQLQDTPLRIVTDLDLANIPVRYRSAEHILVERQEGSDRGRHGPDGAGDLAKNDGLADDAQEDVKSDSEDDLQNNAYHVIREERRNRRRNERRDDQGDVEEDDDVDDHYHAADTRRINGAATNARVKKNYDDDNEDYALDEDYDEDEMAAAAAANTYGHAFQEDAEAEGLPFWHHPCGRSVDLVIASPKATSGRSAKSVARKINRALERVWRQLNMTVLHYKLQRFDKLYYQVIIGVNENDYIPSWVPSKDDLPELSTDKLEPHKLANELARMHTQLQKFSVALEQMSEDNRLDNPMRHNALSETKKHVKLLLCEVEWALLSLTIPLPLAVPRKIMSPSERNITDDTNREIRDWGVLIKYRDFLHGWSNVVAQADRSARSRRSSLSARPVARPSARPRRVSGGLWGPWGLWGSQGDEESEAAVGAGHSPARGRGWARPTRHDHDHAGSAGGSRARRS